LSDLDKQTLIEEIKNETLGLGPIERYLHDPFVADILVNTHNQVYIERNGKLELTNTQFRDPNYGRPIFEVRKKPYHGWACECYSCEPWRDPYGKEKDPED